MPTTQITIQEGTRWDTVALNAYGSAMEIKRLIEANPLIPISPRLTGGTVLNIPIIEDNLVKTDKELLPPWKK